jgi:hypothetical protein
MIWYLLYPFRGYVANRTVISKQPANFYRRTTEAPVLDQKHPLRSAFTRYGNNAARHSVIALLISIATAVILIYPFPFLYTNDFTNGASNLPHHVWTSAQPFEGPANTRPDVVMRSMWVHGMRNLCILWFPLLIPCRELYESIRTERSSERIRYTR